MEFVKALLSDEKSEIIPNEDDWFAPLIGDWEFDYFDRKGRKLKGEWFFRRVLEGTAIEDIFICPSRVEKVTNPQPDGEYGVAVRMYNAQKKQYDMTYSCTKGVTRLTVKKDDGKIIGSVDGTNNKWMFCEVTDNEFHWKSVDTSKTEETIVYCEVFAKRKQ